MSYKNKFKDFTFCRLSLQSLFVLLLVISGCVSNTGSQRVFALPDLNTGNYVSFAVENTTPNNGVVYQMINQGIENTFSTKGFTFVAAEKPDLLIRYVLLIDRGERLVEQTIPTQKGIYSKRYMEPVNEAKFLVNIVDTKLGKVVWKASTVKDITGKDLPAAEQVNERIREFFESFPERG